MSAGRVEAIYISPASDIAMRPVPSVVAEAGRGLIGDRYHGKKHRHVSVQVSEDLAAAADVFGAPIAHDLTRRNITVSGLDLPTKPGTRITIGGVLMETVRIAAPCKLLDDGIGAGARAALRSRAGTIFRLLASGPIAVGDRIEHAESPSPDSDTD